MKPIINLTEQISLRSRLTEAFDSFFKSFGQSDTSVHMPARTAMAFSEELALLLAETIELRKGAEKEERLLKSLILASGLRVLDFPSLIITVEDRSRRDLDKEGLTAHFGAEAVAPFLKETQFKMVSLIRKV